MQFKRKTKGRENKDYNYYHNTVKRKLKELTIEIKNMQLEISKIETRSKTYYALDKKLSTLSTDVRELEGQLADYNLAFDK
jgi:intraflagellar transport protein 74